jgi:hypothetical protein
MGVRFPDIKEQRAEDRVSCLGIRCLQFRGDSRYGGGAGKEDILQKTTRVLVILVNYLSNEVGCLGFVAGSRKSAF